MIAEKILFCDQNTKKKGCCANALTRGLDERICIGTA